MIIKAATRELNRVIGFGVEKSGHSVFPLPQICTIFPCANTATALHGDKSHFLFSPPARGGELSPTFPSRTVRWSPYYMLLTFFRPTAAYHPPKGGQARIQKSNKETPPVRPRKSHCSKFLMKRDSWFLSIFLLAILQLSYCMATRCGQMHDKTVRIDCKNWLVLRARKKEDVLRADGGIIRWGEGGGIRGSEGKVKEGQSVWTRSSSALWYRSNGFSVCTWFAPRPWGEGPGIVGWGMDEESNERLQPEALDQFRLLACDRQVCWPPRFLPCWTWFELKICLRKKSAYILRFFFIKRFSKVHEETYEKKGQSPLETRESRQ